ncbi:hypothetical protein B0T10DRAFT_564468 [Thelonectria olida]|uniref:Clr5 domain-containing protein n=1 Tax=Thelonectria olida TaxID=1576542 RepID=A0A9P8VXT2_9HYPO|nr:hypothetical protein B0T10DRAFT_564468 [Thelonectria olida]
MLWDSRGWKLKDVMNFMKTNHGFAASEKMYKDRLSAWGLGRNIRKSEMQHMAGIKLRRDAAGKRTKFRLRGCPVETRKIDRWIKKERNSLGDHDFRPCVDSEVSGFPDIEYETADESDETISTRQHSGSSDISVPLTTGLSSTCRCVSKKFRLIEHLPDGTCNERDVMRDHANLLGVSSGHCRNRQCNPPTIFEVCTMQGQMSLTLLSEALGRELCLLLPALIPSTNEPIDGALLHDQHHILRKRLDTMCSSCGADPARLDLVQELDLLVGQFLENKEFFEMSDSEKSDEIEAGQSMVTDSLIDQMGQMERSLDACHAILKAINLEEMAKHETPNDERDVELERNVKALNDAFLRVDFLATMPATLQTEEDEASSRIQALYGTQQPPSCDPSTDSFPQVFVKPLTETSQKGNSPNNRMTPGQEASTRNNMSSDTLTEFIPPIESGEIIGPSERSSPRNVSSNPQHHKLYEELVKAARRGDVPAVQSLLDQGAPTDMNPVQMHAAPLAVASYHGRRSVVEILLQRGANLNQLRGWSFLGAPFFNQRPTCPALGRAIYAGHDDIADLLIREGGIRVPRELRQRHQGWRAPKTSREARPLITGPDKAQPESNQYRFNGDINKIKDLRRNFVMQYLQMRKATRKSVTKFRICMGTFRDYRDVWNDGIQVLRGLCRLSLPPSLRDTLSFLCIARAIAETLRDNMDDYFDEFAYDLAHWESTFETQSDRKAYLEALKLTWDVTLDCFKWHHQSPSQHQLLLDLRDYAAELVLQANGALGIDSSGSYLHQDDSQPGINSRVPEQMGLLDSMVAPHISQINHRASHDPNFNPLIVCLVTGIIFALVVYFSKEFIITFSVPSQQDNWKSNDTANPTLLSRPQTPNEDAHMAFYDMLV